MDRYREQRSYRGSVDNDKYYKDRREKRHRDHKDNQEQEKRVRRREKRDHNTGEDVKDQERTRRCRDDDYKEEERRKAHVDEVKKVDDDADKKKIKRTREEEDMEKRRRRVHEWQQQKRTKQNNADSGKSWTLDGESSDDVEADVTNGDEIDPLDAFMNSMVIPQVTTAVSYENRMKADNSDSDNDEEEDPLEDDDEFMKLAKKTKVDKLSLVDHSKIDYIPFRKNLYIQVKDIQNMTHEQVDAYRKQAELKIHGKDVPKPIQAWHQAGLTTKVLEKIIQKMKYEKPMPIQAQALPVIMSGRDCIGVAKTGSGKTLAFVLPMLRHIMDQPPLESGDGPIGLIMAPTRELVRQIYSDIKKFTKILRLKCVPVYGGAGVAQQIRELKRGAEIVVCTPGRMIGILCTSGGKITNLTRVSYLVMDEADRMFDMGFEPLITRIVQNTQPNRQTILFSATFPRQVEVLARKVLNKPVEIQVGGRSVVNKDITQLVEVRPPGNERFYRLLELLGEWYEKGKVLIFVQSQDRCDCLFTDLLKHGYPCLSLHGGKDQTDRESTISDFKSNVCNLLVATSIAARGLDVKELELVVNYDAPNHYEDYVHRVGRTGRAGRKGFAVTFLSSEDDERYAPDLVNALELSNQVVPDDLKALADSFMARVNQGLVQAHGTGYGGTGFKFNQEEDEVRKAAKKARARQYGFEEDEPDDSEDDSVQKAGGDISQQAVIAQAAASQQPSTSGVPVSLPSVVLGNEGAARAAALAAAMNLQHNLVRIQSKSLLDYYTAELEINDFPQNARWKVTHKETLGPISEWTGAAVTTRGQYVQPGRIPAPGERKLYLFIEGRSEQSVKRAKAELKRVLEDITTQAASLPSSQPQPGRY